MLIMLKELKDILNKKITKLNGKLLEGKVNHDTAFPPLPNYLQSWFLLGDCSLKTLDKKIPETICKFYTVCDSEKYNEIMHHFVSLAWDMNQSFSSLSTPHNLLSISHALAISVSKLSVTVVLVFKFFLLY